MTDELVDIVSAVSDGTGVIGAPVRGVRAFLRRDEAKNMLRAVQRELEARYERDAFRSDLYEQLARLLQDPALSVPFEGAARGDADALDAVRAYLADHLGTESRAASAEVAAVIAEAIAQHVGRAQRSAEAAVDAVGRMRSRQTERGFEALHGELVDFRADFERGREELLEAIRDRRAGGRAPQRFVLPQATRLRGRDGELRRAREALDQATTVTISGLGGVGKSALAVELARRHADAARVVFLPMRGLQDPPADPADLLAELLAEFGLGPDEIPESLAARSDLWRSITGDQALLVVLDDARDAAQVRPLLPGHGAPAIVTSRGVLAGLQSLLVPLDVLDDVGARAMLVDVLGDDRVADELTAAGELADLCGHLPLALFIGGRRLASRPAWAIEELNQLLRDEHRRLDGLELGDLAVRASFNLSYALLPEDDAATFRFLGVFAAPMIRGDAVSALRGADAVEQLERLCDLGLLESSSTGSYRIHDLLRIFAAERFAQTPREAQAAALARLACHLSEEASSRAKVLEQPEADFDAYGAAIRWFDAEWATLVQVVPTLEQLHLNEEVGELATAVARYSGLRRRWDGWVTIARAAVASAERGGDADVLARACQNLGICLYESGHFDDARAQFERALSVAAEARDPAGQARAVAQLGRADKDAGRLDAAIEQLRRATSLYREAQDRYGEASALGDLGNALDEARDFPEAVDAHRRALALFEQLEYTPGTALEHGNLAISLANLGEFADAAAAARRAIELHERLDDAFLATKAQRQLADYLLGLGEIDDALTTVEAARRASEELGDVLGVAESLATRARVKRVRGDVGAAITDHVAADNAFARAGDVAGRARHLVTYAETQLEARNDIEAAEELLERAITLTDGSEEQEVRLQLLNRVAELKDETGDASGAELRLQAELAAARDAGDELRTALMLAALGRWHAVWGEAETAWRLLTEARSHDAETDYTRDDLVDVVITGAPDLNRRRRLGALAVSVSATLGRPVARLPIEVVDGQHEPDWSAGPGGIRIAAWLLDTPDSRSLLRLAATLYGAIVHHVLARAGVDIMTPLGSALLIAARTWVQHRVFVIEGELPEDSLPLPSLRPDSPPDDVAVVLGAALATNDIARTRLAAWLPEARPEDRNTVARIEAALGRTTHAAPFIRAVADLYYASQ